MSNNLDGPAGGAPAEQTPAESTGTYDLRYEAQKIIDAIEPRAGACMTLMCALHEAWQAGVERRRPIWRFDD